jgi:hypothetical protein
MNEEPLEEISEPTRWRRPGWEARVVRNEDGEGWAVEMRQLGCGPGRDGEEEPALVGPWTMGRDKKNPKPLDQSAFFTLVKTASEVLRRHEQQARARLHRSFRYTRADGLQVKAELDLVGDDDEPYGRLVCTDDVTGEELRSGRVPVKFALQATSLDRFLEDVER